MSQGLLAIDQGTTSSRAILFSPEGEILDLKQKELTLTYPHKGWVEQDPVDIWNDTLWACRMVLDAAEHKSIDVPALGITNQRETTIVWNKNTGRPVYNAIVWQDRRTSEFCKSLKEKGHEEAISSKTGLLIDPYFSASKIAWILENVDNARAQANAGELLFGTVDSYLIWKFTGGKNHVTDVTNASRTMLYDIVQQRWDEELLELFNIPSSMLPQVLDNVDDFGIVSASVFGKDIKIGGVAGDQQSAVIGQACFEKGMVKSTYGTGCFALVNIGAEFKKSQNNLLTTIAYRFNNQAHYAIEGSIFVAGAAIQWLRDGLEFFSNAADSERLAVSVPDNNEVYFVPAFTGLGAPHWNPDARAIITGLSRESTKAHITRASLEAQGYQTLDLMAAMEKDGGTSPDVIRADGGLVANGFMCQFLSDMLQKPVEVPEISESTAWGAACLAGLSAGIFKDLDDIIRVWKLKKRYEPQMNNAERDRLYLGWKKSIDMLSP